METIIWSLLIMFYIIISAFFLGMIFLKEKKKQERLQDAKRDYLLDEVLDSMK